MTPSHAPATGTRATPEADRKRAQKGTGTVFKTVNNGVEGYLARLTYTDDYGQKWTVTGFGPTPTLALQRRSKNLAKRVAGGKAKPRKGTRSIEALIPQWQASQGRSVKEQSKLAQRQTLLKWVTPYITCPVTDITTPMLKTHFEVTLPEELHAGSGAIENSYKALRSFLNWCVKDADLLVKNPLLGVKQKRVNARVDEDDREFINKRVRITKGLLRWLADPTCPHHEHYLLVLTMLAGLRRGETLGLDWSCVHDIKSKNACYITVKQQLMRETGRGYFIQPSTKTKKTRKVYVHEELRLALLARKNEKREATEAWAEGLVFLRADGRILDYHTYNNVWHTVLEAYMSRRPHYKPAASDYWRPHSNRKIFATLLGETGVPVAVAASLLGHSSEAMSFYYMAATKETATAGMEGVAARLLGEKQ